MDPAVENPLPGWLIQQRQEKNMQTVSSSEELRKLLKRELLVSCQYLVGQIGVMQTILLRGLIVVK